MRKFFIIALLALFSLSLSAQKKEIADARTNIKKSVNLDKAEDSMRNLLKSPENQKNEKIWLTLFDAVKKQYEQLNEKLYLKQQSDTAKLFVHTRHMFDVLESLDSIDVSNTNNNPVYRKKHASYLDLNRKNLFNGGLYFLKKNNYQDAVSYFTTYIDCAEQPLFSSYSYNEKDEKGISDAGYWLTYCGYKLHDYTLIEKYYKFAIKDESREVYTLQYLAEAYLLKNDENAYRSTLEQGFSKYPSSNYFFSHLANYYLKNNYYGELIDICDKVLSSDSENVEALVALSTTYYKTQQYDSCIEISNRLLTMDQSIPQIYINLGLSYYKPISDLFNVTVPTKAQRQKLHDVCVKARPYLEKYEEMCPEDTDSYALPLYNIYLVLNDGDGFEKMEKILYGN